MHIVVCILQGYETTVEYFINSVGSATSGVFSQFLFGKKWSVMNKVLEDDLIKELSVFLLD